MKLPNLTEIKKTLVSIVGVAALLASTGLLHGTAEAIVNAVIAVATALGVYVTPNGVQAPVSPTT